MDRLLRHLSRWWLVLVAVAGIMAVVWLHNDFGITWDEPVQSRYGELVLQYYTSGFQDDECNRFLNLKYYGPLFETLCAAVYQPLELPKFAVRHICIGLTTVAGIVGLIRLSHAFTAPLLPIFSVLALLSMPRFVGHAFNNSKDLPFASCFIWGMYGIARIYTGNPMRLPVFIGTGLVIGLTLAIRIGGVLLWLFHLMAGAIYFVRAWQATAAFPQRVNVRTWVLGTTLLIVVSWLVMICPWPWTHQAPIAAPVEAFRATLQFPVEKPVLFQGATWPSTDLPRHYLLSYLVITTPIPLAFLLIVGILYAMRRLCRVEATGAWMAHVLLLLWLGFPIVYFALRQPNAYDGIRHFLFLVPAMSLVAGLGANWVWTSLRERVPRLWLTIGLLIVILLPIVDVVRLHPYQAAYFNSWVGGLRGAVGRYDLDYWASSYKEAAEWINAQNAQSGKSPVSVLIAGNNHSRLCAEYYLDRNIPREAMFAANVPGRLPASFDYYIAMTRYGLDKNFPESPVIHAIERDGAIFTVIKSR